MTLVAGVDLGGTTASLALADLDGSIVNENKIATESYEGPQRVLERIAEGILALGQEAGQKPAAIGIGLPGLVDMDAGTSKFMPNLPTNWVNVEVSEILSSLVGCPVELINDARAATLGELRFGHGREADSLALFTLGTGIGGGIAIDGKLRLGPIGAAGEFGHLAVIPYGPLCGCGNRGCLETLISGPALTGEAVRLMRSGRAPKLNDLVDGDISLVTPKTMAEAANAGDEVLKATITSRITRRVSWHRSRQRADNRPSGNHRAQRRSRRNGRAYSRTGPANDPRTSQYGANRSDSGREITDRRAGGSVRNPGPRRGRGCVARMAAWARHQTDALDAASG